MKRIIPLLIFLITLFNLNLISASYSGFDDWYNNYFKNMWNQERNYDSGSSNNRFNNNVARDYYKDVVETKHTTIIENENPQNFERMKTTVIEKQEIERENRIPLYNYNYPSNYVYDSRIPSYNYNSRMCNYGNVPYSSWRYRVYDRNNPQYYDYSPMYDSCLGYYNWRY